MPVEILVVRKTKTSESEGAAVIDRQYDALDRLVKFTDAAGNGIEYGYNKGGTLRTRKYCGALWNYHSGQIALRRSANRNPALAVPSVATSAAFASEAPSQKQHEAYLRHTDFLRFASNVWWYFFGFTRVTALRPTPLIFFPKNHSGRRQKIGLSPARFRDLTADDFPRLRRSITSDHEGFRIQRGSVLFSFVRDTGFRVFAEVVVGLCDPGTVGVEVVENGNRAESAIFTGGSNAGNKDARKSSQ